MLHRPLLYIVYGTQARPSTVKPNQIKPMIYPNCGQMLTLGITEINGELNIIWRSSTTDRSHQINCDDSVRFVKIRLTHHEFHQFTRNYEGRE